MSQLERSIYKGRKQDSDRKNLHITIFRSSTVPLSVHFFIEKWQKKSYKMLTTAHRNAIFGMHTHISPKYNIWSSTMTLKVNEGHWRSLKVSGRVTNWAKTQKQTIFKENLFGNFYSTLNLLSNSIKHCKILLFWKFSNFFENALSTRPPS